MTSAPRRRTLGRRAFLALGAAAALSGCGLRIGTPTERRQAEAEESTRGRAAAILASADGPEHKDELAALRDAIGPQWSPSGEGYPEIPKQQSVEDALQAVIDIVLRDLHTLGGPQTAVIVDVAVAASNLVKDWKPPQERFARLPALGSPTWIEEPGLSKKAEDDAAASLHGFAQAAYQASYGYSKAAIAAGPATPEGRTAARRMESLARAASDANALLKETGRDEAANRPAWKLPHKPDSPAAAKELALKLEDVVAAGLFGVFGDPRAVSLGARELKASADARIAFGGRQVLRYEGADQ